MARPGKGSQFTNRVRRKPATVEINGEPVLLRSLSVAQWVAFQEWRESTKDAPGSNVEFARRLVAASVVDEDGFTFLTPEDVADLDIGTLDDLAGHIARINGVEDAPGKSPAPKPTSPES